MDKKEFLSGLEQSLSVLEEDELRDIISEYEQHIDMKVARGLTEEEAIADFGSFQELTAQLLEAYHVRADYAAGTGRKAGDGASRKQVWAAGNEKGAEDKWSSRLWKGVRETVFCVKGWLRWMKEQICRPFAGMLKGPDKEKAGMAEEEPKWETGSPVLGGNGGFREDGQERIRLPEDSRGVGRKEGGMNRRRKMTERDGRGMMEQTGAAAGRGMRALGRGIRNLWNWAAGVIWWGIRAAWNVCWILFAMFGVVFGLFSLFVIGVLAILLMEGYPLVGVTVGCVGLALCMFSAAGLGGTMMVKLRREPGPKRPEPWSWKPEPGVKRPEPGSWRAERGPKESEPGSWKAERGLKQPDLRMRRAEEEKPEPWSQEPEPKRPEHGPWSTREAGAQERKPEEGRRELKVVDSEFGQKKNILERDPEIPGQNRRESGRTGRTGEERTESDAGREAGQDA